MLCFRVSVERLLKGVYSNGDDVAQEAGMSALSQASGRVSVRLAPMGVLLRLALYPAARPGHL